MIYLVTLGTVMLVIGFYLRFRSTGWRRVVLETLGSTVLGWLAGMMIGVGARFGMWTIPFFNGREWTFSLDGTIQVIIVFSLFGIGLGLLYEFVFRKIGGLLFGAIIVIATSYPLYLAAAEQLTFEPGVLPAVVVTLLVVGLMFIPYALVLSGSLRAWDRFLSTRLTLRQ